MLIFSPRFRSCNPEKRLRLLGAGFTLIELLTVVTIMGVLSAILFTSLASVRAKARDGKRLKDMETISGAVEQYYRDNSHYPITNCSTNGGSAYAAYQNGTWSTKVICPSVGAAGSNPLATELAPYISLPLTDPSGPISGGSDAGYLYRSDDGKDYCVMIWRTPENMNNFKSSLIDMSRCGAVGSGGACTNSAQNNIYINTRPGTTGC